MSTQPLTIQVPTPLYQHLQQRANEARRSVEEETLQVLAAAVPTEGSPARGHGKRDPIA
jgi:plasmid stability protein